MNLDEVWQAIDAVHDWLRTQLSALRAGDHTGRDLRAHCLTFCTAVRRHHTGEDAGVFPLLARRHPELRPVIDELVRDHDQVAVMLRTVEVLVDGLAADPDPAHRRRLQAELDGVAALLESHFGYEERTIPRRSTLHSSTAPSSTPATSVVRPTGRPDPRSGGRCGRGGW